MLDLPASAAWWLLPFAAPIAFWAAWSDLKSMKIPNKAVMALLAVFFVVGLIALPPEVWAWRWSHFAVVLVIGFVMNLVGLIGAGDAKFAAAMAPFVALGDVTFFLMLFAAVLIAAFVAHRVARALPMVRGLAPHWESWTRRDFPMGLALSGALVAYLVIGVLHGA